MESLLAVLNRITPYGSERGFVELCWHQLSNVITSKEASAWSSDKRDHFMVFTNFFIVTARAVFTVRDALIRANVSDLSSILLIELAESLDDLQEFASAVGQDELIETIDDYVEIILDRTNYSLEVTKIEFAAGYFKMFFLTVHDLNLKKRIQKISEFFHNKTLIYE
ncbi:hypothetical protein [Chitinophaga ginsengisegetis]|uniref:hypothetical protein n=1 Tax=Chitinophaga ginsengisegetis TaxID=393003 RepID=UPI000DB94FA1|nr:hypothetical protein [Chitinophaga ginsengisegetis]MDR6569934.1 hypothetical protein [Chitinophaga ginsengisegetis]MDR6649667.1 hypothetical protein [Chitinophaga ginsengisegetis]MDR6656130.1 hypothetical protein [Chitinophaga ginsengisegetis]